MPDCTVFAKPGSVAIGGHGTIVDATIMNAPSSTKNAGKARDPDMHSGPFACDCGAAGRVHPDNAVAARVRKRACGEASRLGLRVSDAIFPHMWPRRPLVRCERNQARFLDPAAETEEQSWRSYAVAMLFFRVAGFLTLYAL